ncbi:phosphoglycerate mutase (2,3-diphosphoglycerate-independent) [Candidatus Woesebacteria bacterium RBG_16_42_24]|uniref:2,3-bisphosphoglycerate-independent phosphoglycerate mutase n=1 Tax=Candidatus Woesebacteria bacterium RBG_16_42_24 TaxID=1802485 RepID=A0A1F7XJE2_9BACT|nr:MAG: phosphoglycerate mutase (2,3-diphosphoglycerate-independent) [Candidatus Woesebacteria bacterium RBG_16_42_24]
MNPDPPRFVVLAILDGWGIAPAGAGNAINQARTPNFSRFWASYPHTQLSASGEAVGLPKGDAGNTETGHLNLGAGRIVYQDLVRINMSIAEGGFFANKTLLGAFEHAKKNSSNLHFMGLIGAGGVHSNMEHLFALIQLAKRQNFSNFFLHLFTDGRDSAPTSAKIYINQIKNILKREGAGKIASVMGRYWAMDRDYRWERTQKAYVALTKGMGQIVKTPEEAIELSYQESATDEFIAPSIISDEKGQPLALIKDGDSVVFFNFRIDRPRQLSKAFLLKDFSKANEVTEFDPYQVEYLGRHTPIKEDISRPLFERGKSLENLYFVTMTLYANSLVGAGAKVAFPPEVIEMPLGRVVSNQGLLQLRATESEKERFVTFYFNGLREHTFPGEENMIIPSPKVKTYDLKPEMSAKTLTDSVLNYMRVRHEYSLILINYPNADMVGHTGNIKPAIAACEAVDACLGHLESFISANSGILLITADHGNAEEMINLHSGGVDTEHSANPVPFIAVGKPFLGNPTMLTSGILADVAPTVLSLLEIPVPNTMTGRNLLSSIWKK